MTKNIKLNGIMYPYAIKYKLDEDKYISGAKSKKGYLV